MNKMFFVDSENVGDNWVSLLDTVGDEDKLLVFYTANGPHMNYKNVIRLKNSSKDVTFIECCVGNNALDFQLSTQLGLCVANMPDSEFVIVSGDTGFDAVVKYWKQRAIPISRIKAQDCVTMEETTSEKPVATSDKQDTQPATTIQTVSAEADAGMDNAKEILYVVGKDNLQVLNSTLRSIFGEKKGATYYKNFKSNTAYSNFIAKHKKLSLSERYKLYLSIVFEETADGAKMPVDLPAFAVKTWKEKKNLNSFNASLQTKYGKDMGGKYYSLLKTHIKYLDKLK